MSIKNMLDTILAEAAGQEPASKVESDITKQGGLGSSATRTADKSGAEPECKLPEDSTKVAGKVKKDSGRSADKGGELPAHTGTTINDPAGKVTKGQGTEVQGNSNANDGLGESVSEVITARLKEAVEFKTDLSALKGLCEAQELGEEFATQAAEIFEAAVNDILTTKLDEMCATATEIVCESVEAYAEKLEEDVDQYLNFVVTEWAEENRLAIVHGARTELSESFMAGIKDLLESHYVELPEDKADLYESAVAVGEQLVESLTEANSKIDELESQLMDLEKVTVVESVVSGMSDVRADKIRQLAESISYTGDVVSFGEKLKTLAEGYVGKSTSQKTSSIVEDTGPAVEDTSAAIVESAPHISPEVAAAAKALGKYVRS